MSRRMAVKESVIESDFRSGWPFHVENFTWFLIQCRRYFNGDMDRLLIFCVVSARNLSANNILGEGTLENLGPDRSDWTATKPINLQSIADCSGLPRETARRKLQDLTALGWVKRDEHGNFTTTPKAVADLVALTEKGIEYMARMKAILAPETRRTKARAGNAKSGLASVTSLLPELNADAARTHEPGWITVRDSASDHPICSTFSDDNPSTSHYERFGLVRRIAARRSEETVWPGQRGHS